MIALSDQRHRASRQGLLGLAPLLLLLVLGLSGCVRHKAATREPGPNLLLLTVDTLRVDHMGCYGYSRDTTPNIDRLAKEGTTFLKVFAQRGSTWPSLASILTGLYPATHGVHSNGVFLSQQTPNLAVLLQREGYSCHAVLTNAWEQRWSGFAGKELANKDPRDADAAALARDWLRENAGQQPFFLWVHLVAPHAPYDPPADYRGFTDSDYDGPLDGSWVSTVRLMFQPQQYKEADMAQVLALYDGEVAFSDAMIGQILDLMEELDLLDSTLVVMSADHGEELGDHQRFLFHNASVYDAVMQIPLVLRQPGAIPAGQRLDELVQSIDMAPTLLELLGFPVPASFQGRSLLPLLEGASLPERRAWGEWENDILVARSADYTWWSNPADFYPPLVPRGLLEQAGVAHLERNNHLVLAREALFDNRRDKDQQDNLAADMPELLGSFRDAASIFMQNTGWTFGGKPRASQGPMDPQLKKQLLELGYPVD